MQAIILRTVFFLSYFDIDIYYFVIKCIYRERNFDLAKKTGTRNIPHFFQVVRDFEFFWLVIFFFKGLRGIILFAKQRTSIVRFSVGFYEYKSISSVQLYRL